MIRILSCLSVFSTSFLVIGCGNSGLNEIQLLAEAKFEEAEKSELSAGGKVSERRQSQKKVGGTKLESRSAGSASAKEEHSSAEARLPDGAKPATSVVVIPREVSRSPESPVVAAPPAAPAMPSVPAQPSAESPQAALERQQLEFRQRVLFVDLTYRVCLGRAPESGGLVSWTNLIATKQATFDQVQNGICSNAEGQIASAYREILGRYPDPSGRQSWLGELTSGRLTIAQIRQSLADSDERKAIDLQRKMESLRAELAALEKQRQEVLERLKKS